MYDPCTTAAVLLGAKQWPSDDRYPAAPTFEAAAHGIHDYLVDPAGLGLSAGNVYSLFNDPRLPAEQLHRVEEFLADRRATRGRLDDLLVYFVGHGEYDADDSTYYLITRSTRTTRRMSALAAGDLARLLAEHARGIRVRVVIDACYAAAAAAGFHTGPFAKSHTALLCSAAADTRSAGADGRGNTMFTGALLDVLRQGGTAGNGHLSLLDVCELAGRVIAERHQAAGVRPLVLSGPHQPADGPVAARPLFPNRRPVSDQPTAAISPLAPATALEYLRAASRMAGGVVDEALACVRVGSSEDTLWCRSRISRMLTELEDIGEVIAELSAPDHLGRLAVFNRGLRQFQCECDRLLRELEFQVGELQARLADFRHVVPTRHGSRA